MTVEISNNHHSLNSSVLSSDVDVVDGVRFSHQIGKMPLPWIQALRGGDGESMSSQISTPDDGSSFSPEKNRQQEIKDHWNDITTTTTTTTPAWNKPLNAVVYGVGDTTSWPDLSESTRRPIRPSSSYYYTTRTIPADTLSTSHQEIVCPRPPRRQTPSNRGNLTSPVSNNAAQQRLSRRNLNPPAAGIPFNGGLRRPFTPQPPPPPPPPYLPPFPIARIPVVNNLYNNTYYGGTPIVNWPAVNNNNQNYFRREMPRSHPREHDKYPTRNARVPQQQQFPGRVFNRPPLPPPPPPPPAYVMSPFTYLHPMHLVPFILPGPPPPPPPPPPAVPLPPPVQLPLTIPTLPELIVRQIEHYFCDKNLESDYHLKSLMDDQGWVPVTLIANFNRMKNLTDNIGLILDSMKTGSREVEVKEGKLRTRNSWQKWIKKKKNGDVASNNNQ